MDKVNLTMLSLPRNTPMKTGSLASRFTSIIRKAMPINGLPGWERVPLDQKLPMLKCSDNQVIFSKGKIGRSAKIMQLDFDLRSADKIPEYNPLHDPHLSKFFRNKRNLKRLRENHEVTDENDVICTLKDFNEHRYELLRSQLPNIAHVLDMIYKKHNEDVQIAHADGNSIYLSSKFRQQRSGSEMRRRKQMIEEQRLDQRKRLLAQSEAKLRASDEKRKQQRTWMERRRQQNVRKAHDLMDTVNDIKRKRLISLRKLLKFKSDRYKNSMRKLEILRERQKRKQKEDAWEKSLIERMAHEHQCRRQEFQRQWEEMQEKLHPHKPQLQSNTRRRKKESLKPKVDNETFEKMLNEELFAILTASVEIQSGLVDKRTSLQLDDPIYKAAEYIIENVITKFTQDLSFNRVAFSDVQARIEQFLKKARHELISRAKQLIASRRKHFKDGGFCKVSGDGADQECRTFEEFEEFAGFDYIPSDSRIYAIHSNIDWRTVADRNLPPNSIASLLISTQEEDDEKPKLIRDDMLFVEHCVIKFTRDLIVGVGRRVLAAIRCYFQNENMDVRKELLDVDSRYLSKVATKAILSYAANPLNFASSLQFCTNVMSNEIIWSLQLRLLRLPSEPRGILRPHYPCPPSQLSLYDRCHHQHHMSRAVARPKAPSSATRAWISCCRSCS